MGEIAAHFKGVSVSLCRGEGNRRGEEMRKKGERKAEGGKLTPLFPQNLNATHAAVVNFNLPPSFSVATDRLSLCCLPHLAGGCGD